MYVKGACYAARERTEEKLLGTYLYVGNALVQNHVSMEMLVQGAKKNYTVAEAGRNWYETEHEFELLLDGRENLEFMVKPMDGGEVRHYCMKLPGLPKRPDRTTRLRVHIMYESADTCIILVHDVHTKPRGPVRPFRKPRQLHAVMSYFPAVHEMCIRDSSYPVLSLSL